MKISPETDSDPIHVLLVDDSLETLQILASMLRAERFRLTVASDGRKGYQRALTGQPHLILMDIAMPNLDGLSACRLLKADPMTRHIPVIFLTAKNSPEERLRGLQLGGVDYVSKPVLAEEVITRIRIHLNRIRGHVVTHRTDGEPAARHPDEVILGAAIQLIRDQLENLPPFPQIANIVGTHEKKLGQIFRGQLGMTVSTFVAEERIRLSRKLLEETRASIQEIAALVGYGNAGNFTTAFRKRMGLAPRIYRQELQREREK